MGKKLIGNLFRHKGAYSMLVYGLCALLVVLIQSAPFGFPTIFHVRPVPVVPFVLCVAVLEGARAGAAIGTLSGLLWGIYNFRLFGMDALILLALGLVAGLLVEWVLRANFYSAMLLCAGGILLQALLEWLCCYVLMGRQQMLIILLQVYLPGCVYSMLLSPLIFWGVLWLARHIRRRVKE